MAFKDVLIVLISYPDPTPIANLDQAVEFGKILGAHVAAVTFEAEIKLTRSNNLLANLLIDLPEMLSEEKRASVTNAQKLLKAFEATATRLGVSHQKSVEQCIAFQVPDILVDRARLSDLTIMPMQSVDAVEASYAEALIFGSGRPVLIFPVSAGSAHPSALDVVSVAWDFSRPAARALADALPILRKAKRVHVVTVANEKEITTTRSHAQLAEHLSRHDIDIAVDVIDAAGRTIGDTLAAYVKSNNSDLLIMGAYGHSRAREFILGGATRSMLAHTPIPVLLSH